MRDSLTVTAGDFDHDGRADLAIGEPSQTITTSLANTPQADDILDHSSRGNLYVFWNIASHDKLLLADRDLQIAGQEEFDRLGTLNRSPAIDVTGDGVDDLLVGAAGADVNLAGTLKDRAGAVYVLAGTARENPAALPADFTELVSPGAASNVLVKDSTGQPFSIDDTLEIGQTDRWYSFTTLGDGQEGDLVRVSPYGDGQRVIRPHRIGALDPLDGGAYRVELIPQVGGTQQLLGVMEFDISSYYQYSHRVQDIQQVNLVLDYAAGTFAAGNSLAIHLLRDEGDNIVRSTDGSASAVALGQIDLTGRQASGQFTLDVTGSVREHVVRGDTRLTVRLVVNSAQSQFTLQDGEGFATGLHSTTDGALVDLYSAAGVLLDRDKSVIDWRHYTAGTYFVRVHTVLGASSTKPVDYTLEINAPVRGSAHANYDRDILRGGDGEDVLIGGPELDRVFSNSGSDVFVAEFVEERDFSVSVGDSLVGVQGSEESSIQPRPRDFVVPFKDTSLVTAVAKQLGIPASSTDQQARPATARSILASDLSELVKLDLDSLGISDLSGLQYASNLETLNLSDNQLVDLQSLGLTELDLNGNMQSLSALKHLVLDGNGQPILTPHYTLSGSEGFQLRAPIGADLDGDGDLDVVEITNFGLVRWFENLDSAGTFRDLQRIESIGGNSETYPHAVDLDDDGHVDVLAVSGNTLIFFKNLGRGTSWRKYILATDLNSASSVFAADIDLDGHLDVVVQATNLLAWYQNRLDKPTADFSGRNTISSTTVASAPADVDRDGDTDLFVVSATAIAWQENQLVPTGTVSWVNRSIQSLAASYLVAPTPADVDADGDVDLVSSNCCAAQSVGWYENTDGMGNFGTRQTFSTDFAERMLPADIDEDGDLDIVAGGGNIGQLLIFENRDGQGGFSPSQYIFQRLYGNTTRFSDLADLDGDHKLDFLFATRNFFGSPLTWIGHEQTVPTGFAQPLSALTSLQGLSLDGNRLDSLDPLNPLGNYNGSAWMASGKAAISSRTELTIRIPTASGIHSEMIFRHWELISWLARRMTDVPT